MKFLVLTCTQTFMIILNMKCHGGSLYRIFLSKLLIEQRGSPSPISNHRAKLLLRLRNNNEDDACTKYDGAPTLLGSGGTFGEFCLGFLVRVLDLLCLLGMKTMWDEMTCRLLVWGEGRSRRGVREPEPDLELDSTWFTWSWVHNRLGLPGDTQVSQD